MEHDFEKDYHLKNNIDRKFMQDLIDKKDIKESIVKCLHCLKVGGNCAMKRLYF